jgi:hypothetical protein
VPQGDRRGEVTHRKLKAGSANNPAVKRRETDKAKREADTQRMYDRSAQRRAEDDVRTRPRGAIESDIRAQRQKAKGRGLEASKANTEIKKLEAELAKPLKGGNRDKMTAAPARKPRATSSELRDSQRKLFDEAKAKRAAAREAEKEAKLVSVAWRPPARGTKLVPPLTALRERGSVRMSAGAKQAIVKSGQR